MKGFQVPGFIQYTFRPGGVHRDLPENLCEDISAFVKDFQKALMIWKN